MRVLLVNPPFVLPDYFRSFARVGSIQQPLGLAYIASALEQEGHTVRVIDAPALGLDLEGVAGTVRGTVCDLVGITATTPGFYRAVALASRLRRETGALVVVGGPHVSTLPEETMAEPCFDIGVLGEGERTVVELAEALESGRGPMNVNGLVYRANGSLKRTPPRPYIDDLDQLPFPARHLLPSLSRYQPTPSAYIHLPQATMITSRGCPYLCTFCDRTVFGNKYRARSASNVLDEMEEVFHKHGAKEIRFWDDTFNIDRGRVIQICRGIRTRRLDVPWSCLGRVNLVDDELLREMAQAGCWQVEYGIETGSQELLNSIKKGIALDQVRAAVRKTKAASIRVRGFFMLGLPGETESTLRATIDFAKSLELDVAVFHMTIPFPGTELYASALAQGELSREAGYDRYLMFSPDDFPYVPQGLSRETLIRYRSKAYREFYLRPRYILRQLLGIRSLRDIVRYLTGFTVIRNLE